MIDKNNSKLTSQLQSLGFYAALAVYLFLRAIEHIRHSAEFKHTWIGLVGGSLMLLIALVMLIIIWAKIVASAPYTYAYKRNEEKHKSFIGTANSTFRSQAIKPLYLDDNCSLHVLGHIHYDYFNFNLICGLKYKDKTIPFHINNPLIISYLENVPVISICVNNIGFDLLKIPKHRDCCPYYDKDFFPDPNFHGYKFENFDEYEEIYSKIEKLVQTLFLNTKFGEAIFAYCVEVCRFEAEYMQMQENNELAKDYSSGNKLIFHDSIYRDLDSLAGIVEDSQAELKNRFAKYIDDKILYYDAKSILKKKKTKKNNVVQQSMAKIIIIGLDSKKESAIEAKKWLAEYGNKITSAEILLSFYREAIRSRKFGLAHIKSLILSGNKVPVSILTTKNEYANIAVEKAKLLRQSYSAL